MNCPTDAPTHHAAQSKRLLDQHRAEGLFTWRSLKTDHCTHDLLLIDRVTQPIPKKHGVGGARRIGLDIALKLQHIGAIATSWLHSTDADATLPFNYFSAALPPSGVALFPFIHTSTDAKLARRAWLYEQHMALYRQQLEQAGSPYAFTALGSALAVHNLTYAQVRGMPKRNGGEDFHFVNKALKTGYVTNLSAPTITLTARLSHRVPFGTGPALESMSDDERSYKTYHPATFEGLAELLRSFADPKVELPQWVTNITEQLGLPEARHRLANQYSGRTLESALHTWFDGLKTLRFVHYAREVNRDLPLLDIVTNSHSFSGEHHTSGLK